MCEFSFDNFASFSGVVYISVPIQNRGYCFLWKCCVDWLYLRTYGLRAYLDINIDTVRIEIRSAFFCRWKGCKLLYDEDIAKVSSRPILLKKAAVL